MKMLIHQEAFDNSKSRDLIPLECKNCHKIFYRAKNQIQVALKGNSTHTYDYCCLKCWQAKQKKTVSVKCKNCGKIFESIPSKAKRGKNRFCTISCSTTYNNKNKTTGYRRSKLEKYLETQIEKYYPELKCSYNNKKVIGSELDFYFPTLQLAIELNGIFHYKPIYGAAKLQKIKANDLQKTIECKNKDITLFVIDAQSNDKLSEKEKAKYWKIVKDRILKSISDSAPASP